ncbi:MAG: stage V sporulation protein AC [Thermaerobacter sp.]|nr:stage V sporulation protein AC [Thermaerobacter sp.]
MDESRRIEQYQSLVKRMSPKRPVLRNVLWAFFAGGVISLAGQGIMWWFERQGMSAQAAASPTTVVLIGIGALVTGLGWYDRLAKRAGMGAILPITGFANAMVAPAMEFKSEGLIMGVGARLFTIAGPVLVYGMTAAFLVALLRYLITGVA